ncbi:hypothetical protein EJB05_25699, partial [Eragrostis curvula]
MPVERQQTPLPRDAPQVATPPSATITPPPSSRTTILPASPASPTSSAYATSQGMLTAAYAPSAMLPSSSSAAPLPRNLSAESLNLALLFAEEPGHQRTVSFAVVADFISPAHGSMSLTASSAGLTPFGSTSPTLPATTPNERRPLGPPDSSDEEVESDSSDDPPPPNPTFAEQWLPQGRWRAVARYAYAYVSGDAIANPAPFIRAAMHVAAPLLNFELLPSSRGAMLLRFATIADCEFAHTLSPLMYGSTRVDLELSANTDNRFFRDPEWLALLAVTDFPLEHWFEGNIRAAFRCFAVVVEIDPLCLTGYDFSSLRVIVEVRALDNIPEELWLMSPGGEGAVARVTMLRAWPRAAQLDHHSAFVPVFGPPPPPPGGNGALAGHHDPAAQAPPPPPAAPAPEQPPPPPPAPLGPAPPHSAPAATLSQLYDIVEYIPAYPLARLAAFPIIIPINNLLLSLTANPAPAPPKLPMLAITCLRRPTCRPTPYDSPPPPTAAVSTAVVAPGHGRKPRARRAREAAAVPQRHSERLAGKEPSHHVDSTDKAVQLKALKNCLAACSRELKAHVNKKGLLGRKKQPIATADLRKLVSAAGLGGAAAKSIDVVLAVQG